MLYRYLDFFYLDDYTNKEVYDCSQYKSSYFHLKNGCNEHLKKRFNSYSISIKHFSFFVFLFLFLILHFCNKMLKLTLKQFHEHCYDRSFTLFFFFLYIYGIYFLITGDVDQTSVRRQKRLSKLRTLIL